jgi:hypothetical protein
MMDTQKTRDSIQETFFNSNDLDDLLMLPINFMLFQDDNGRMWFIPRFVQRSTKEH